MSNNRKGNKRLSILLVLRSLELMSDKENPIKQQTLANTINELGGILNLNLWCDRKTVGRHLRTLSAAGYKIVSIKGKGCYLESNKFTKQENEMLIKLVEDSNLENDLKLLLSEKIIANGNTLNPEQICKYLKSEFNIKRYHQIICEE